MARNPQSKYGAREKSHDRKKRQRLGGKEILRRLNWLWDRAVYWGGPGDVAREPLLEECRSTGAVIADRLTGCSPGLYAVQVTFDVDMTVAEVADAYSIDPKRLADASWILATATRGQTDLDRFVDDVDRWIAAAYARMTMFSNAQQAAQKVGTDDAAALMIESTCAWLGDSTMRPSGTVPAELIEAELEGTNEESEEKVHCLSAVVLGRRRRGQVPQHLQPWKTLGQLLDQWPVCVLGQFDREDCRRLTSLARQWPALNHRAWAEGVREYLILAGDNADPMLLLEALPPLLTAYRQLTLEPKERLAQMLQSVGRAFQEALAFVRPAGGTGFQWNHEFGGACAGPLAERLERSGLPAFAVARIDGDLHDTALWLLDINLSGLEMMRLKKPRADRGKDPNYLFLDHLQRILEGHLEVDEDCLCATIAVAAGRISALTNPKTAPSALANWLDWCRTYCLPGPGGVGPARLALGCLFNTFRQLPADVKRKHILGCAARHGGHILRQLHRRLGMQQVPAGYDALIVPLTQTDENHENLLLLLASIPREHEEYIPLLFEEGLLQWLNMISRIRSEALPAAMEFLLAVPGNWYDLGPAERVTWSQVFQLADTALARTLADWSLEVYNGPVGDWPTIVCFLDDILSFLTNQDESAARQQYLARRMHYLDRIVGSAIGMARQSAHDELWELDMLLRHRIPILEILFYWEKHKLPTPSAALDELLDAVDREDERALMRGGEPHAIAPEGAEVELSVMLAAGDLERLLTCLRESPVQAYPYPVDPALAWRALREHRQVREFLSSLLAYPEQISRVKALLQRIALALRLQTGATITTGLEVWEKPTTPDNLIMPPRLSEQMSMSLRRLVAYEILLGGEPVIPRKIASICQRRERLENELAYLDERIAIGVADAMAVKRADRIRGYLANNESLAAWIDRDLAKVVGKQMRLTKLAALEKIAAKAIEHHWQLTIGGEGFESNADWENALLLWMGIEHNRRLLRDLLRTQASGDPDWFRKHPVNQRFLTELRAAGVDSDVWAGEFTREYTVHRETWTVRTETNPLRILQMGNLFGTCLRTGGDFAYSTVANAIEMNKRVIYIEDKDHHVVGRKLIAIDRRGRIFGFKSYGRGPWTKILLDRFCKELANRSGATLAARRDDIEDGEILRLFAQWYNDGVELFDRWLYHDDPHTKIVELLNERLPDLFEDDYACCTRAFLVLEEDAVPILQRFAARLRVANLRPIRRETDNMALRDCIDRLISRYG